jgi:hypothetical protein
MKYKLLFLDVDGTLVESNPDGYPSKKVINAIKKINKKIRISLCTGRSYPSANKIIQILGIENNFHVIESGAKILTPSGKFENIKSLTYENIDEIIGQAKDTPLRYGYCVDGEWKNKLQKNDKEIITVLAAHSENEAQTKLILSKLEPLKDKFNMLAGSKWGSINGSVIHITNKESSKESGVKYIQNKLGILKEESIGIGDMFNDLPLFKAVGLKVAMGNGTDELKKQADVVAPTLKEDGVAWLIEKFLIGY